MKFADIDKRFTAIVAEYISKGYTINAPSMSGSQGEVTKIDFERGGEITRILLKRFVEREDGAGSGTFEGVDIIVGKASPECGVVPHDLVGWDTIWESELELEYKERFFQVSNCGPCYYGTKDEAKEATALRLKRWLYGQNHSATRELVDRPEAREIGARWIRRHGLKVVKTDAVQVWKQNGKYIITYRNRTYKLR